ncbi:MAG: hypothetical protein AAF514_00255 [Verrucomicrobiota bacterium]
MKKFLWITGGFLFLSLLILGGLFRYFNGPGGDGIVGEITVDGRRYAVTQTWNGDYTSGEPYFIRFVYQLEDGSWGGCYVSHEDARWPSAQLVYDPENDWIDIHCFGNLRARLDRKAETFELFGFRSRRISDAPGGPATSPDFVGVEGG